MYRRPALAPQLVERGALAVLARGLSSTRRRRPSSSSSPRAAPAPVAPPAPAAPAPAPVAAAAPARAAPRPRPRRRLFHGALLPRRADPQALVVLHHLQISLGRPRLRVRVPRFRPEGADDAPAHGALLEAAVGSPFVGVRRRAPAGRELPLLGLVAGDDVAVKISMFGEFRLVLLPARGFRVGHGHELGHGFMSAFGRLLERKISLARSECCQNVILVPCNSRGDRCACSAFWPWV